MALTGSSGTGHAKAFSDCSTPSMYSSIGIADSVSVLSVPRDPSTRATRAIVVSSGASRTVQKS